VGLVHPKESPIMTEHPNAASARAALEAFARGDLDALTESFSDDIVWHAPGTNRFSGKFEGRAAVMDRFARMMEAGVRTTFEIHDVVANDDHVVSLVRVKVQNASGTSYEGPQVQVLHVRDGKAFEFWGMNQDQAAFDLILDS